MNSLALLASIAALALLGACSFGHKKFSQERNGFDKSDDYVIQVDDFGSFWDPTAATEVLDSIATASSEKNTIVVLFIHGWHHNAAHNDSNAVNFSKTLRDLRQKLDDNKGGSPGAYRQSRAELTVNGDVRVIGIYIGWRGKSLPMPLDYLTFWGRKSAAERVGEGDLREFLIRLNSIYMDRNATNSNDHKRPLFGLISVGHSFGGQVLFKAVVNTLENELINATKTSINGVAPALGSVSGFGDLVVLINPALEALQYERIHALNRRVNYSNRQAPVLMVLSSETDLARKRFFPIGRWIGSVFRPAFRGAQSGLWTQALGEYPPQRTHKVEVVQSDGNIFPGFDSLIYKNDPCAIVNFDLTNVPSIGGVRLKPINSHQPFSPFLVAYADGKVVLQHSGIFEEILRNFMNDYIAIAQGKRLLLRNHDTHLCAGS